MNSRLSSTCGSLYPESAAGFESYSTALPKYVPETYFDTMSDKNNLPRANIMWDYFDESQRENWHNVSSFPGYEHSQDLKNTAEYHAMFANQGNMALGSPDSIHKHYDSSQEGINASGGSFSSVKVEDASPKLDDMVYPSTSSLASSLSQDLEHSPTMGRSHVYPPRGAMPAASEHKSAMEESQDSQFKSPIAMSSKLSLQSKLGIYPDVTTLINSDSTVNAPMVETTFVDHTICNICNKRFTRDMNRHQGIHREQKRFNCVYPKELCKHRTGSFNRRYDFKKHLLNKHFTFDSKSIKGTPSLKDKLKHWGTCTCGGRFQGQTWIDDHILTKNDDERCPHLKMI